MSKGIFKKKRLWKAFEINNDEKINEIFKNSRQSKTTRKKAKIQTINIYTSPIITKHKTAFEYIEIPIIEQYKVNNHIIIFENGQIISPLKNNEFLLPYFGINSQKSNDKKSLLDDIIINQDEFYE